MNLPHKRWKKKYFFVHEQKPNQKWKNNNENHRWVNVSVGSLEYISAICDIFTSFFCAHSKHPCRMCALWSLNGVSVCVRTYVTVTGYRVNMSNTTSQPRAAYDAKMWPPRKIQCEGKNPLVLIPFNAWINSFSLLSSRVSISLDFSLGCVLCIIPHDLGRHSNFNVTFCTAYMYSNKLLGITAHKNRTNTRSIAQSSHCIVYDFPSFGTRHTKCDGDEMWTVFRDIRTVEQALQTARFFFT